MAKNADTENVSMLDALRNAPAEESFDIVNPWIAEKEGDGIEGDVIGIGGYHDDTYSDKVLRTLIIQDDAGETWSIIPFHRKLRSEMAKNVAMVGDRVAVLYLGEEQSATDPTKFMKQYRIAVKKNRSMRGARSQA